ncbi:hypothetical protein ACFQH8_18520 [Halomicroarcula sp. GCM10025710]
MISDNKTATASANGILVERTLSIEDGWVVGTIQVESISQRPDVVYVTEELPDDLPVESVGFKRDDPPSDGEITPQRVSVALPVEDDAVSVDFGIELADTVDDVAFDEPEIERVETAAPSPSVAQTDGGENPATEGDDDTATAPPSEVDGAGTTASTDGPDQADGPTTGASGAGQQGVYASSGSVKDVIRQTDEEGTGNAGAADGAGEARQTHSPPRSVETRLDYLSARVDEFAAYTTALESFLDEEGTAQEFIDRVDGEVADLATALEEVSEEVDTIRETNQDLGEEPGTGPTNSRTASTTPNNPSRTTSTPSGHSSTTTWRDSTRVSTIRATTSIRFAPITRRSRPASAISRRRSRGTPRPSTPSRRRSRTSPTTSTRCERRSRRSAPTSRDSASSGPHWPTPSAAPGVPRRPSTSKGATPAW